MALDDERNGALLEKELSDVREHVVQIEAVLVYLLISMVALFLAAQSGHRLLLWAMAILSLLGIGQVMRVRNPASEARTRLLNVATGAASGAGLGITIDAAFGLLTLGAAAAIGGILGGVVGALAPVPAPPKKWLDWNDAFKMLYEQRETDNRLANPDKIKKVLAEEIPSFEFTPNIKSYAESDIKNFLNHKSPARPPG
jgi:hypothetical protein